MHALVSLNLPEANLDLARKENALYVWDRIRRKRLLLTPEEWVRQHFIHFLLGEGYPQSQFALEAGFYLHNQLRRTDILIYKDQKPALLVECKAPQIKISQDSFDQASRYNLELNAAIIILTNGLKHYIGRVDRENSTYHFLQELPRYEEL